MSDTNTQENTKKLESDSGDSDAKSDSAKEQLGQEAEEVHSANAWEKADLGDTERKNKFLRLMGAGKKEHHGRFVIGDHKPENNRSTSDPDKLQNQLEDQYEQSMQHRLASGRRGHIGLGFQDTDKATEQESDTMVESNDFERQSDVPGDQEEIKQNNGDQDREARDRPDREARDRPDREARDRPSREARDRPDREARDRPDREARDRPSREARDRPDREARDRPDREARGRPSREANDGPDRKRISTGDCTIDKVTDEKKMKFAKSSN